MLLLKIDLTQLLKTLISSWSDPTFIKHASNSTQICMFIYLKMINRIIMLSQIYFLNRHYKRHSDNLWISSKIYFDKSRYFKGNHTWNHSMVTEYIWGIEEARNGPCIIHLLFSYIGSNMGNWDLRVCDKYHTDINK